MSYLFLVNIGPVQDFIASARQTRDLYCGSWLLSDLARTVALQIMEKNTLKSLIFPAPTGMDELKSETFNVANKIVALIDQKPQELAQCVEKKMRDRLDNIRGQAYKNVPLPKADQEMAKKQIEDLIEFFWVALPYDKQNKTERYYEGKREQLEALMAARKNTRNFQAVPWKSMHLPKSSIDGKLESVIPEDRYHYRGLSNEKKQEKISELYKYFGAGPAERLSGVDLLKRHATKPEQRSNNSSKSPETTTPDFEALSTSHIAALPFLKRLKLIQEPGLNDVREAWKAYIEKFREVDPSQDLVRKIPKNYPEHLILDQCDGGMLFEDQLIDMLHLPASDPATITHLQPIKTALRKFYQAVDDQFTALGLGKADPNPYYALLQADGDSMGKVLDAQAQHGHDKHREFSRALSSFAEGVGCIVKHHEGALVYAGGDDVLAFLPLHTVLQCADELAKQFYESLKCFTNCKGDTPTLSVGIAIVHHLDTLKEARKLAKQAEDHAKEVDGKNALAITISKRSGGEYGIAGSWKSIGSYLEKLINYCRADAIPDGTAYELRDLVLRLTASDAQEEKIACALQNVIKQEMRRILQRKLYVPVGKLPQEQAKIVEQFLKAQLGIKEEQQECKKITIPVAMDQFINELMVAQTLAEARQLVDPKKGLELWQSGLLNHEIL